MLTLHEYEALLHMQYTKGRTNSRLYETSTSSKTTGVVLL